MISIGRQLYFHLRTTKFMSVGELLIKEFHTQCLRDLEDAEFLLEHSRHREHAAWLLQQSYEKLVKHFFIRFKVELQQRDPLKVYKHVKEKGHHDSPYLPLDLASEIGNELWLSMTRKSIDLMALDEPMRTTISAALDKFPKDLKGQFDISTQSTKETMQRIFGSKEWFETAIKASGGHIESRLNRIDIQGFVQKEFAQQVDSFRELHRIPGFSSAMGAMGTSSSRYYGYIATMLSLSPWLMMHVTASRYPLPEYGFQNLVLYRELGDVLTQQLKFLAREIRKLYDGTEEVFVAMKEIKKWTD